MQEKAEERSQAKGQRLVLWAFLLLLLVVVASTQVTFFVVQPIGAVPEGRTLPIRRTGRLKFINSADTRAGSPHTLTLSLQRALPGRSSLAAERASCDVLPRS